MRYQKISRKQMTERLIARISGKEMIVKAPVVDSVAGPVAVQLVENPVVVQSKVIEKEIVIPEKVANIIVMEDKPKKKFYGGNKNVK